MPSSRPSVTSAGGGPRRAPLPADPPQSRHPGRRGGGPGRGVSDPRRGTRQCGGGAAGGRLLRALPARYRPLAAVFARHGTVPANGCLSDVVERDAHRSGANSSAGSERLPYTQDVGGSNPSSPTRIRALARLLPALRGSPSVEAIGMFLFRLVTLAVVGASVLSPLSAQGIPRGSRTCVVSRELGATVHGGQSVRLRARGLRARGQDRHRPPRRA